MQCCTNKIVEVSHTVSDAERSCPAVLCLRFSMDLCMACLHAALMKSERSSPDYHEMRR